MEMDTEMHELKSRSLPPFPLTHYLSIDWVSISMSKTNNYWISTVLMQLLPLLLLLFWLVRIVIWSDYLFVLQRQHLLHLFNFSSNKTRANVEKLLLLFAKANERVEKNYHFDFCWVYFYCQQKGSKCIRLFAIHVHIAFHTPHTLLHAHIMWWTSTNKPNFHWSTSVVSRWRCTTLPTLPSK